jgi:hypothetical protein
MNSQLVDTRHSALGNQPPILLDDHEKFKIEADQGRFNRTIALPVKDSSIIPQSTQDGDTQEQEDFAIEDKIASAFEPNSR